MRAIGWLFAVLGALAIFAWGTAYIGTVTLFHKDFPVQFHGLGVVGFVLIAVWLFFDWGTISALGKDQTVTRATTSSLMLFVAAGLMVAANVASLRYDKRWDITASKRFSLTDQSVKITGGLTDKVEVLAFFPSGSPEEDDFRDLMKEYLDHTTLIEVNYFDPNSDNLVMEKEKVTSSYGTVIIRVGEREQRLTSGFNEEGFTNALVKATSTTSHSICAVGGHGEGGADDEGDPAGMGSVVSMLTKQNYVLSTVQLMSAQPKPEECDVLVLAGPKADLLPTELDRLAQYVAAGGKLIVMLDPIVAPGTAADMARYGVAVGNNAVLEADPYRQVPQGPSFVVLDGQSLPGHPTTDKLTDATVLALARSVGKGPEIVGLKVTEVAHSSDQSWGETSLDDVQNNPPNPDPTTDLMGPVPLIAAVEVEDPAAIAETSAVGALPTVEGAAALAAPPPLLEKLPKKAGGKVMVFGDSDFASNQLSTWHQNADLFLGTVGWMVGDESQISIHPNEAKTGQIEVGIIGLILTPLVAFIGVPGLALLGAVGTFMRRRNR